DSAGGVVWARRASTQSRRAGGTAERVGEPQSSAEISAQDAKTIRRGLSDSKLTQSNGEPPRVYPCRSKAGLEPQPGQQVVRGLQPADQADPGLQDVPHVLAPHGADAASLGQPGVKPVPELLLLALDQDLLAFAAWLVARVSGPPALSWLTQARTCRLD